MFVIFESTIGCMQLSLLPFMLEPRD